MHRTLLVALCLVGTANAADITSVLPGGAYRVDDFSSSTVWVGGVAPGTADRVFVERTGFVWTLTYDVGAPAVLEGWYNGGTIVFFDQPLTVTNNLSVRDGTFHDQGHDITVLGELQNSSNGSGDGFGGTLVRGGGTYTLGGLRLQRNSNFSFRPGDTIDGSYHALLGSGTYPDIEVRQDAALYGDDLDIGLSFDDATGDINLGYTSAVDNSQITLYWDSSLQGSIDWTLRWKGNHETALRTYYTNGQLVVGALPSGESFNPTDNIFYNSSDDYTYVAFEQLDSDGDGVPDVSDNCPTDNQKGDPGFCGCDWIDVDADLDSFVDSCVHTTAFVDDRATILPGATIDADAVVSARAQVGGTVDQRAIISRNAVVLGTVGEDTVIGRGVTIDAGATIGDGALISYAADIGNSSVGDDTVIGPLVNIGDSCTLGNNVAIGRDTSLGNSVQIANDVVFGPDSQINNSCVFEQSVKIRKGAIIGDNVTVRQGAKVGRDSTLGAISGAATEIGSNASLRAVVTVPAGFCVPSNETIPRGIEVDTACP